MSERPKVYGFCEAGCKFETVHKSDFDKSAAFVPVTLDESGKAEVEAVAKYKICASPVAENLAQSTAATIPAGACCAAIGDIVYIFGGEGGAVKAYNTKTSAMTTKTATYVTYYACCAAVGKYIYLFGGGSTSGGKRNVVVKYDTEADSFVILSANLPNSISRACCAAVGKYIYLFGGSSSSDMILKFDASTDTITTYNPMSTTLSNACCVAVGDVIYIFGGMTTGQALRSYVQKYDTKTSKLSNTSVAFAWGYACCALIGDKVVVVGGGNGVVDQTKTINIFTIDGDTLSDPEVSSCSLAVAVQDACCAAVGAYVYIFGGTYTSTWSTPCVQKYNGGTYDAELAFKYKDGSAEKKFIIPLEVYDEYRGYFAAEIVAAKIDADGETLTLVVELNGRRDIYEIAGSDISDPLKLEISNADAVYLYNVDAELVAGIPAYSSADNGKVLKIVNGAPAWVAES